MRQIVSGLVIPDDNFLEVLTEDGNLWTFAKNCNEDGSRNLGHTKLTDSEFADFAKFAEKTVVTVAYWSRDWKDDWSICTRVRLEVFENKGLA